ncbi:hypothetical protein GCM10010326_24060 [Streptomyces xanthochromogenes]|uniref:Uncharacterized protein n=1 Tax=Streptomyces xanthochromogenes TaxID=67384 RepID=A0ABQ2ZZJ5_9ACTN|nr:hypothetical protein GCM10010326_24060 [Streptomyces xanthochromogenes]
MCVTAATAVTNATGCRLGQESGPSRIRDSRDVPAEPEPGSGAGAPVLDVPAVSGPWSASGPAPAGLVRVRAVDVLVLAVLSARVGVGSAVVTAALPAHAVSPGMRDPMQVHTVRAGAVRPALAHGLLGPEVSPEILPRFQGRRPRVPSCPKLARGRPAGRGALDAIAAVSPVG